MDVSETDPITPVPPPLCPPSVPQEMWDMIPAERRQEALEHAAKNLRRAIHPVHSITSFLENIGVVAMVKAPIQAPRPTFADLLKAIQK